MLYPLAIRIASLFNPKAKKWIAGRKDILQRVQQELQSGELRVWMHCSSLGEFEQGRPLIEAIKQKSPYYKIVLTFFSPSGYEVRKDYELADYVFYLPMDGKANAKRFIELVQPSFVLFIKYEFWYYYLITLQQKNIPVFLVSATFRASQGFFKWYGALLRKMLGSFRYLFVQEPASQELLAAIGIEEQVMISGDTRYDRVAAIASQAKSFPLIEEFKGLHHLLIAGSTWPDDEKLLRQNLSALPEHWKLVIAPHEIDRAHIDDVKELFGDEAVCYTELSKTNARSYRVLIIDNIGMLSSLFRYGELAYIGGGFQKGGIHNTLEPAIFGLPVIFGPVYEKFAEARQLVALGYAFPVADAAAYKEVLKQLIGNDMHRQSLQAAIKDYVHQQTGATDRIMEVLKSCRLL